MYKKDMQKRIEDLKRVHQIQGSKGNYDTSTYMLGVFNGLELAMSIVEGREPAYKEIPGFNPVL